MIRGLLIALLPILLAVAFFLLVPSSGQDLKAFEGTWKSIPVDSEKELSWIRIWSTEHQEEPSTGLTPLTGYFESEQVFGEVITDGLWNFESYRPLRLNIIAENQALVAAIELSVDGNAMTLLASEDYDVVTVQNWDKHSNAIRFLRID